MDLAQAFEDVGSGKRAESFAGFARSQGLQWIAEALAATGTATARRRKLPAETPASGPAVATSSAVVQARDRLGAAPLEALFETTAARWATASADSPPVAGLAVDGVDGSSLRIPDTPENEAAFGQSQHHSRSGRLAAGVPRETGFDITAAS